jgi:hypothetical protein
MTRQYHSYSHALRDRLRYAKPGSYPIVPRNLYSQLGNMCRVRAVHRAPELRSGRRRIAIFLYLSDYFGSAFRIILADLRNRELTRVRRCAAGRPRSTAASM